MPQYCDSIHNAVKQRGKTDYVFGFFPLELAMRIVLILFMCGSKNILR